MFSIRLLIEIILFFPLDLVYRFVLIKVSYLWFRATTIKSFKLIVTTWDENQFLKCCYKSIAIFKWQLKKKTLADKLISIVCRKYMPYKQYATFFKQNKCLNSIWQICFGLHFLLKCIKIEKNSYSTWKTNNFYNNDGDPLTKYGIYDYKQ